MEIQKEQIGVVDQEKMLVYTIPDHMVLCGWKEKSIVNKLDINIIRDIWCLITDLEVKLLFTDT
jgi:hypothetical protein